MIEQRDRVVYFAPTRGRHFMTKKGAANAEARALLNRKYPGERESRDEYGRIEHASWYWSDDERFRRVYDRLVRRLLRLKTPNNLTPRDGESE